MSHRKTAALSRRSLLKGSGLLVVSIGMPVSLDLALSLGSAYAQDGKPPLAPDQLDSFLAIDRNGEVTAFYGKMDMGHGIEIALRQIVAEELDVPVRSVNVVMGDTARTVNQGGASSSNGIQDGGMQLRSAAAEARRVLVERAAKRLGVPATQLSVADGMVMAGGIPARQVSYADLIGDRFFNVKLKWNGKVGNELSAVGIGKPKAPSEYKIVGKPVPRDDVAPRVFAQTDYVTDIKVPGMVHGRMIRPPIVGSTPVAVDEGSIRHIPGTKIVWNKGFLGVVADKEWDAIRAAQELKVQWSDAAPPFPAFEQLYDTIRSTAPAARKVESNNGDVNKAFADGSRIVEAEYEWPFQSHASMAPACAVVEIKDGGVTVWTGSQKPHYTRDGVASILGLPPEQVRAIWVPGPGSYGRNDAGDAAVDAAVLARAVGKPVRLQGMRYEGHGWDPKGPASIHRARAALDAQNNVIAYEFISKGFSRLEIQSNESSSNQSLAGQLMGEELKPTQAFRVPEEAYAFANKRLGWETIPAFVDRASPLRTSHLRDPVGPQIHFASESFIDEIATAAQIDPVEFRLRYVKEPRDAEIIKAAAERAGWTPKPTPQPRQSGDVLTGRGIAYAQRDGTIVAVVAEVEVTRSTGRVWPRRFVVAHDCGQIINPRGLKQCIEGNIVQGTSRALHEEVTFDRNSVTSVDWETYPILDIKDAPESIEIVLIDRPNTAPTGAGEPSIRPVAAAIGNAIFDATGIRLRRAPFTPERVKAALSVI